MNENGTLEKDPKDSDFTLEDDLSLENVDQAFKDREKGEENFWTAWNMMEPKHRGIYIEHIRASLEGADESKYPDIDFFKKVIERWDEGGLE